MKKLTILVGCIFTFLLLASSQPTHAESVSIPASSCTGDCVQLGEIRELVDYGGFYCWEFATTYNHEYTFDLTNVSFTIDKARLRLTPIGSSAYDAGFQFSIIIYAGDSGGGLDFAEHNFENPVEYWEDDGTVGAYDFAEALQPYAGQVVTVGFFWTVPLGCLPAEQPIPPVGTTDEYIFNYIGLGQTGEPMLDLADETMGLPDLPDPLAIELQASHVEDAPNHWFIVLPVALISLALVTRWKLGRVRS